MGTRRRQMKRRRRRATVKIADDRGIESLKILNSKVA